MGKVSSSFSCNEDDIWQMQQLLRTNEIPRIVYSNSDTSRRSSYDGNPSSLFKNADVLSHFK